MIALHAVDALWFGSHDETHRIRPATADEAAAFAVVKIGFTNLMTVVRRADGAKLTFGFKPGDDIDTALDCELAGWFDDELDAVAGG